MSHTAEATKPKGREFAFLALGALGVVYGDIGTSVLYALRECFHSGHGVPATHENILGVLSLIFYALIIVISIKYLSFVMRADNRGEGGTLALMALISRTGERRRSHVVLVALALFGTALLYGDGMITPAISVLSAVEGLQLASPAVHGFILPLTVGILVGLFLFQKRGTAGIGAIFGPLMVLWFLAIGAMGLWHIFDEPRVLAAFEPQHAISFFVRNRGQGFFVLGAVFLVMTGGESLYADMGHFGRAPIRIAWFVLVLPALLLNYFGQGALLMKHPDAAENPFFRLAPEWGLYPLIAVATMAAVIASQAVISGAFSLTRQAVQLGYSPRVEIDHTSERQIGQIYVPVVNWALMISAIGLVLGFKTSSNLAAAYGVAVITTMVITTILMFVVQREIWHWKLPNALLFSAFFLAIDLAFFSANILKVPDGGWFPLVMGALIYALMSTWKRGRALLASNFRMRSLPLDLFLRDIAAHPPTRVRGTAVFMTANPEGVPPVMLHHLKHNKVLHEQVVLLSIETLEVPNVSSDERVTVESLGEGVYRIAAHYGFIETPVIPDILDCCTAKGLKFKLGDTTFYLGRETILATKRPGLARWRKKLFTLMSRNAQSASSFFQLPPNRVVELGAQIEL